MVTPAGSTPSAARQVSVFPLPDSPTSPTISPGRMPSETPRIAVAAPSCTLMCRSSRLSSALVPGAGREGRSGPAPVAAGRPGAARSGDLRLSIVIGRLQSRVGSDDRIWLGGQRARAAAVTEGIGQGVQRGYGDGDERGRDERRPRRLVQVVEIGGEHAAPGGRGG